MSFELSGWALSVVLGLLFAGAYVVSIALMCELCRLIYVSCRTFIEVVDRDWGRIAWWKRPLYVVLIWCSEWLDSDDWYTVTSLQSKRWEYEPLFGLRRRK